MKYTILNRHFESISGYCKETEPSGLKTAALVGIAVGSAVAILVVAVLIYFLCLKTTKKLRFAYIMYMHIPLTSFYTFYKHNMKFGNERTSHLLILL